VNAGGIRGENAAAKWLQRQGFRIIERNFRTRMGEIDIIAQQGDTVAMVEVKYRSSAAFAPAMAFVDIHKQRRLRAAAGAWLAIHGEHNLRFDVIEVYPAGNQLEIRHIPDAF